MQRIRVQNLYGQPSKTIFFLFFYEKFENRKYCSIKAVQVMVLRGSISAHVWTSDLNSKINLLD
jgi:hypothetical protein